MKRIVLALSAALLVSSAAGAQKYIGSPAQDLFDQAAFYIETQYNGPSTVNFVDLIAKYQVLVDTACAKEQQQCSYETIDSLLAEMFEEIKDPHASYLNPENVAAFNQQQTGVSTQPGPRVGITNGGYLEINGQVTQFGGFSERVLELIKSGQAKLISQDRQIFNVIANGPAAKAGVKYGDRWIGYNNKLFADFADLTSYVNFLGDFSTKIANGETVTLELQRGSEKKRFSIPLKGETGLNFAPLATYELLENGYAVIRISDYLPQGIGQQIHDFVGQAISQNVKGIIFNMRDNTGGLAQNQIATVASIIEKPELARLTPRYNANKGTQEWVWENSTVIRRLVSNPSITLERLTIRNAQLFKGPISVVIDSSCASACEYFASNVQRSKRGKVIGVPSVGIGNTNFGRLNLINGGQAGLPTVLAVWPDGTPLPSQITPDIQSDNDEYNLFLTGRDPGVEKAIASMGGF